MPDLNVNVPAIEVLLHYVASGIGAIAGPLLAPWRASREDKARLASARVDAEVHRIQAASEARTSAIIAKARSEAVEYLLAPDAEIGGTLTFTRDDIIQRIEYQERKRLANARSVVEDAADDLGHKAVADHDPDPDWTARFFDHVQDVSSEDMQRIWARILAGEVEIPGRTSLRTMDTLHNMTQKDAEMFRNICDFVTNARFIYYDHEVNTLDALSVDHLLHLQECGLVNIEHGLSNRFKWSSNEHFFLDYHTGLLWITEKRSHRGALDVPIVRLTSIGRELYRMSQHALHMEYLQAFARFLSSQGYQLDYLEGAKMSPDGTLQYGSCMRIGARSE